MRRLRALLRDDSLSRKASLNALASVLDYGGRVVVGLLVAPILVSRLGDVVYGVYQTLLRLIGYATPAGGRPSQALKWTIARHQSSVEYDEKRLQVGSAFAVWLIFLPPLAFVGALIAWFAPLILGLPEDLHTIARVAAAVLVLDLILVNLLTIPQSVVQGENLGYKRMGASLVVVLIGGGLAVVAAETGLGLIGVCASVAVTTVLTGLLYLRVARRHVSWFGMQRAPRDEVRAFLKISGWFLLWNLVMQLMRGSDVVVLAVAGSPEEVTVYTLARYVPETIFGVVAIAVSAVMPGLGGLLGGGETSRAASVRSESMVVTWLLATAAGAAFLLLGHSFLSVWVGERYYPGDWATLVIVVMTLQFAFIRNDSSIIDLTLDLRSKVVLGFVSAIAAVAVAAVLVGVADLGIAGLGLGFIAGRSIVSVAYPVSVCNTLGLRLRGQIAGALRPLALSAVLFAAALALEPIARTDSWLVLIGLGAVATIVFGGFAFQVGLSGTQRGRVLRRARQVAGRS